MKEDKDEHNSFNVKVMSTATNLGGESSTDEEIKWLLDSGCSDHIVNSDKYFYKVIDLKNPVNIKVGDGFQLKANKIGNIFVYFNVSNKLIKTEIKNVYYVQNMKQNLLSVSCIINSNNSVIFKNDTVKIYNCKEELIAEASIKNKLFQLIGKVSNKNDSEVTSNSSYKEMTKKEKWHRMLGHVNFQDLKYLCESQLVKGLPQKIENEFLKCETCLENKMTNLKFNNNRSRAKEILEIIHTDVHGPITQTGYKGQKYFVSFIDDYSKIATVFCIKNKSEVFNCFVEYINLMHNQTGMRVKEIRCDNGREYLNKEFYGLAKREGIYIRPSPPYTHELNGVAERYNRTIMNRARCLLSESELDKSYWPECVYTAAYLGNRLPANTNIRKTPYEIFFKKRPDATNLHLYGSKAYVRIPEECRTSKLNSKAVKGILIGYTDTGYKILVNDKIIISRHVKFIERDEKYIQINNDSSDIDEETEDVNKKEIENEVDENVESEEVLNTKRPKRDIKLPKKI